MTDSTYTHIAILADRTGSMGAIPDPGSAQTKATLTTTGIKSLISDQASQPGTATFSLVQFDSQGADRVLWFDADPADRLARWAIMPRGSTPPLDATGHLIADTGEHLAGMPEDQRPGRVIFVIGTDGEENSSREYTKQQVADLVKRQREEYGWDFVFIGADFDAFAEAGGMGVAAQSSLQTSGVAMAAACNATSDAITRSRVGGQSVSYSDEERSRASGGKQ